MDNIKDFTLKELEEKLRCFGAPTYCAKQIFNWIYKKGSRSFSLMSNLSVALRKKLEGSFYISGLKLINSVKSVDATEKFLFELRGANLIESVIIPAEKRVTGCISTQAGCKFACKFCASGVAGFQRNLTCGEILDEILFMEEHKKLTHIVFMGTGEPLDNYDNVLKAIRIINSPESLNIGARKITISTSGVIPGIKKLAEEGLQVELSVSLHAADDKTRSRIMPVNKKYPLNLLLKACVDYADKTGRQVTFEYVLIKGLNSDLQSAQNLVKILKGVKLAKVNLIPANPVKELGVMPAEKAAISLFKDYIHKQGIPVTLRRERGSGIEAACGQLRLRYEK